jgi:hypothetical protein
MTEQRPKISRRSILKIGGGSTLLPFATALGNLSGPSRAMARARTSDLAAIDTLQAQLLVRVARSLFPHDFLGDENYMRVVTSIDAKLAANPVTAQVVKDALASFPAEFLTMRDDARENYLRSIEQSPVFKIVYQETITGLYGDKAVRNLLGYEGSSVEFGGYLERGFDDLDWLPGVSTESK